jgi:hypothetical protein
MFHRMLHHVTKECMKTSVSATKTVRVLQHLPFAVVFLRLHRYDCYVHIHEYISIYMLLSTHHVHAFAWLRLSCHSWSKHS